jgi:TPR repeat protein
MGKPVRRKGGGGVQGAKRARNFDAEVFFEENFEALRAGAVVLIVIGLVALNAFPGNNTPYPLSFQPGTSVTAEELLAAAKAGNKHAQYQIGEYAKTGQSITRGEKDPAIAVDWYERAAAQDFAPAQYALAQMVESGWGCEKDVRRAEALYKKAALNPVFEETTGNTRGYAMTALGSVHYHGTPPFSVDYDQARKWFEAAGELEHTEAHYVRSTFVYFYEFASDFFALPSPSFLAPPPRSLPRTSSSAEPVRHAYEGHRLSG